MIRNVAVICTTFNEVRSIQQLLQHLERNAEFIDEIIFVDAGSTDGTVSAIETFARESRVPIRLLEVEGCSRAAGRNLAVEMANCEWVVTIDAGCYPADNWAQILVSVINSSPGAVAVKGGYVAIRGKTLISAAVALGFTSSIKAQRRRRNFPSSRSYGFSVAAHAAVGGYPDLPGAGEDTAFVKLIRSVGPEADGTEAIAYWNRDESLASEIRRQVGYVRGDAQSGMNNALYLKRLPLTAVLLAALVSGRRSAHLVGLAPIGMFAVLAARDLSRKDFANAPGACILAISLRVLLEILRPLMFGIERLATSGVRRVRA
jgi:glycosyltransferase involved in cell wall biosynthesis